MAPRSWLSRPDVSGRRVILSSESAFRDSEILSRFDERHLGGPVRDAARACPFGHESVRSLAKYALPPKYFYLPNQFWRHKNTQAVVDALAILKNESRRCVVAASGSPEDPREPDYFSGLMRQVEVAASKRIFAISE